MISSLSQKLSGIFSSLFSAKRITEESISDSIREVRLALLDADVNYQAVKDFIARVKQKVIGEEIWKHVSPGQQFVKCLHEELTASLAADQAGLLLRGNPAVILLCGLQGAGKTTTCAKLADYLLREKKAKKYAERRVVILRGTGRLPRAVPTVSYSPPSGLLLSPRGGIRTVALKAIIKPCSLS